MINHCIQPVDLPPWRSRLILSVLVLGFIALMGRAAYLQGMHNDFLQEKGESRYSRVVEMNANRGMITDRNGQILAISSPTASVYADPQLVEIEPEKLKKLSTLLAMPPDQINERLNRKNSRFVYLKRQLVPDLAEETINLKIPGIYISYESKRYYPEGEFAAHVLGFTDINDEGQEGVERGWQSMLDGELGSRKVIKDNKGRIIEDVEKIRMAKEGQDIFLSIDRRIQYRAQRSGKTT